MVVAAQNFKVTNVTPPAAIVDNASYTTTEVDTLGYDYALFLVVLGATDIAMTALAVTHSDTAGSGHANITGLVWGTSANHVGTTSTLPSATDDDKVFIAEVNLIGKKRYLDVTATAGNGTAGTYASILCLLSRAEDTPTTAAQRGAAEILRA